MTTPYTVADYLFDRLGELGVDTVFGVPGDFTLGLLDHIDDRDDLSWVGTANELGAGYAADGYARMRGVGVVCSTFGVGELSAINAVAGAYAEHVAVLQLVGSPTEPVQAAGRPTHHSLGDGDFDHTLRMTVEVTVAQAKLTATTAPGEIDRVLATMVALHQPGYLSLPADVAEAPCTPPSGALAVPAATTDATVLRQFTAAALRLLDGRSPVVLADIYVHRAGAQDELDRFVKVGGLRYASLLWGRRVVDESGPGYLGLYLGAASSPEVRDAIENTACLVTAGVYFTDLISGFFSQHLDANVRIDLQPHTAVVAGEVFTGIEMSDALAALTDVIPPADPADTDPVPTPDAVPVADAVDADSPLSQAVLWERVATALTSSDIVLADQGTSFYGMAGQHLPHGAVFIGQPLWASIGYTLPAIVGAAVAAPERRPVLLIGDGAAQLTIAELGTIIRLRIPAVIVVVNNNGYTVERAIHGPDKAYNDIAAWNWTALPAAFGGTPDTVRAHRATTANELSAAFADAAERPGMLTLIEAVTGELDVPPVLEAVAEAAARANTKS
ncbi:alpha-keto acid decarboxylase family protein [Gordonia insulae]|uniref:Alpha-keto-acid decarboxylase n=1 Tax=Gordonia insulae TaxID=2420509 RepID=A0A3G8JW20_9ACTN|nr:thiamine pyrophosphate-binding protein [Gordonia insulae]AZG48380.1 Alpha-keto-acid decarboxylase [Gordonia insulae]